MAEDVKDNADYTKALAITAFLLAYPDEAWWQDFPEWRKAVQEVRMPQARELLGEFCDYVADLGREEYEAAYVRDFDFSQNTNLYLTNHDRTDFGKQSEEMQRYKVLFLQNGFDVDKELPDYLPALLELAAAIPAGKAREVLATAKPKMELLRSRLVEAKLAQTFLVDVALMEAAGLEAATA